MGRNHLATGSLGLLVLLSRLPLLGIGFGSDMDGWRLAATARAIRSTHVYSASRFPGFPVHEIISAFLWSGQPYPLNGAAAAMGAAACMAFAGILRRAGAGCPFLGGLALGFVPAIYIYSTCPLDYVWALSLVLGSFLQLLSDRWLCAGALLGLAGGCRVSSLGLIIPFAVIAVRSGNLRASAGALARLVLPCLLVTGLCFVPVGSRYGTGFLTFYRAGYPRLATVAYRASLGTWGLAGTLAVLGTALFMSTPYGRERVRRTLRQSGERALMLAAAASIAVTVATFLFHPDKSVYLIPAVPFLLLIAWKVLPARGIALLGTALIISPLALGTQVITPGPSPGGSHVGLDIRFEGRSIRVLPGGPVIIEYMERRKRLADLDLLVSHIRSLPAGSVLVTGWWFTEISAAGRDREVPGVQVVRWLDAPTYRMAQAGGRAIYYAPGQLIYNRPNTGFDLQQAGARPLETANGGPP